MALISAVTNGLAASTSRNRINTALASVSTGDIDAGAILNADVGDAAAIARKKLALRDNVIFAKDHGAIGDGATDDTAAIQAAIDALEADTTKDTLHFEEGVYNLDTPVANSDTNSSPNIYLEVGAVDLAGRDIHITGDSAQLLSNSANPTNSPLSLKISSSACPFDEKNLPPSGHC